MVSFIETTICLRKIGCFIIAGSLTYTILNYAGIKKYLLPVTKTCDIIRQMKNETLLERETQVDSIFFWPENLDCRKHITSKISCDSHFCSRNKLHLLINMLRSATETIELSMFLLTSSEIAQALLDVQKKGVTIRVINEEGMSSSSESKLQLLIHEGIEIKSKKLGSQMHHKFCLIDSNNAHKCNLLTGSLNWTLQGLAGNWENIIILRHRKVITQFRNEFNELWTYFDETQKKPLVLRNNNKKQDYNKYN